MSMYSNSINFLDRNARAGLRQAGSVGGGWTTAIGGGVGALTGGSIGYINNELDGTAYGAAGGAILGLAAGALTGGLGKNYVRGQAGKMVGPTLPFVGPLPKGYGSIYNDIRAGANGGFWNEVF